MADISASAVRELRERTGAGMMDCKHALVGTNGDMEKAIDFLREKGIAKAAKKAARTAADGRVFCYLHTNAKIASMVELNCETDFVAKTDEFQELGHELAMQVAATAPLYIDPEEIPAEVLDREKDIYRQQALDEGKPEKIVDKIAEGKVQKYYETVCLLEQPYIRDGDKKVKDLVIANIAKLGENIKIGKIARFAIGE